MSLTPAGYIFFAVVALSLGLGIAAGRRMGKNDRMGCVGFGFMMLLSLAVTGLFFGMTYAFYDYSSTKVDLLLHGKSYPAHVVDFEAREHQDDEGNWVTNYYPVVKFTTEEGETLTRTLPDADMEHEHRVGETRTVYYHAGKDGVTAFGGMTFVALGGMLILLTALGLGFVALVLYAFGARMERFTPAMGNVVLKGLIPFMMICFDALLIYGLLYGNTSQSWWVKPLLIFFILVLSLFIPGYFRLLSKKGKRK